MANVGDSFKPGDEVPDSGIYRVIHDPRHTAEREVTCVRGKEFPPYGTCKHPRFVLVRVTEHIDSKVEHINVVKERFKAAMARRRERQQCS
jgi:hypothetical protein